MLGLHRIAVDLGLISIMFDRVVSSGDNSLVYSSPTVQTDFRRETMGVSSASVVYVSPGGEISVSRVCWEDRVWDATLHPETRKPPEILLIGADFPRGVLNEDPDTFQDVGCGVGVGVLATCSVQGLAKNNKRWAVPLDSLFAGMRVNNIREQCVIHNKRQTKGFGVMNASQLYALLEGLSRLSLP